MKPRPHSRKMRVVLLGAGVLGKYIGLGLASASRVGNVRVVDRDCNETGQGFDSALVGCPKANALARQMEAFNRDLSVEAIHGDIRHLAMGLFACDLLMTALDSVPARIIANFAFQRLSIPYWIDAGLLAPSLVRVSVFAQGKAAPCYECGLDGAAYESEQSYPCQQADTPPPTRAPEYLAMVAGGLAVECAETLVGTSNAMRLSRELLFDVSSRKLVETRLERRNSCRLEHGAFKIHKLRKAPSQIALAAAFALGPSRRLRPVPASLEVPGHLFVREVACKCGERRAVLRLNGRLRSAEQACASCGRAMTPLGTGLSNALVRDVLTPRLLAQPLSALGLRPADVVAIRHGGSVDYYELGNA